MLFNQVSNQSEVFEVNKSTSKLSEVIGIADSDFFLLYIELPFGETVTLSKLWQALGNQGIPEYFSDRRLCHKILDQKEQRTGLLFRIAVWWTPAKANEDFLITEFYLSKTLYLIPLSYAHLYKNAPQILKKSDSFQNILTFDFSKNTVPHRCFAFYQNKDLILYLEEPIAPKISREQRIEEILKEHAIGDKAFFENAKGKSSYNTFYCPNLDSKVQFQVGIGSASAFETSDYYSEHLNFLTPYEVNQSLLKKRWAISLKALAIFWISFLLILGAVEGGFRFLQKNNQNRIAKNPKIQQLEQLQSALITSSAKISEELNQTLELKKQYRPWAEVFTAISSWIGQSQIKLDNSKISNVNVDWNSLRALENGILRIKFKVYEWSVLETLESQIDFLKEQIKANRVEILDRQQRDTSSKSGPEVYFTLEVEL